MRAATSGFALALILIAGVAHAMPAQVLLVRHAEKASAPAGDPALSEAGRQRAEALKTALRAAAVDAVLTTPYRRTRETAAPLAAARGLEPIVVPTEGDHIAAVLARLRQLPAGSTALVVGHSNTLAPLIRELGGPSLPDLSECEFDRLFVLDTGPPAKLVEARYGATTAGCRAGGF